MLTLTGRALGVDAGESFERDFIEKSMSKIRHVARNERLTADDVHVRAAWVCNSERDYYYSKFGRAALGEVAELLPGRPLQASHTYSVGMLGLPLGRFFDAEGPVYRQQPGKRKVDSYWAKGFYYVTKDEQGDAIVRRIDNGTYQEVSLGWSCLGADCSICGNYIGDRSKCQHVPGEVYEEGLCDFEFSGILGVYETSLVFAGGQKGTSTFDPESGAARGLTAGGGSLSGEVYRETLAPDLAWRSPLRESRMAELLSGTAKTADITELRDFKLRAESTEARTGRMSVQSVVCSKERFESMSDAKRWCREHDFRVDKSDSNDSSFRFHQYNSGTSDVRTINLEKDGSVKAVVTKKQSDQKTEGRTVRTFSDLFA